MHKQIRGLGAESPVFGAERQKGAQIPNYKWVIKQALNTRFPHRIRGRLQDITKKTRAFLRPAAALVFFTHILLLPPLLPAQQDADQRIVISDSGVYEALSSLYLEQGKTLVSRTFPYTREELRQSLRRLDFADLHEAGKSAYREIEKFLEDEPLYEEDGGLRFYPSIRFNAEGYLHSDRGNSEWVYDGRDRQPFFGFFTDIVVAGRLDLYIDITAQKDLFQTGGDKDNHTSLMTSPYQFDLSFPYRGGASFGGKHWNLWLGRDKLNWGNGRTGNLMLSDADLYHEGAKFSASYKRFKFTWLVLGLESWTDPEVFGTEAWDYTGGFKKPYSYPDYFFKDENDVPIPHTDDNQDGVPDSIERFKLFMAHRFEVLPFDSLRIALNESVIYGGKYPDLRIFNPMLVYHNFYLKDNMNSMMSLELDYVPLPGVLLYGQFAMDQLSTSFEQDVYGRDIEPNAVGYMAGLEYRRAAGSGYISAGYEYVQTSPWLYIREHPLVSYLSTRRIHSEARKDVLGDHNYFYLNTPLGYVYGSDVIINSFMVSYTAAFRWALYAEYRLMYIGENGINSAFNTDSAWDKKTPSGDFEVKYYVSLGGWYRFTAGISAFAEASVMHNDKGTDCQLAAGVRWKLE
ncbi:MAG: capsule assembly Wzi family protein [Spirochaetales bacterium]|nr:capsule assembly Wzi family protein [Spirochaetales bacterium]